MDSSKKTTKQYRKPKLNRWGKVNLLTQGGYAYFPAVESTIYYASLQI